MKKILIIGFLAIFLVVIIAVILAVIIAFIVIRPTTEAINEKLAGKFAAIVFIPEGIPPPNRTFSETVYFWEMETVQNEVTGVRFRYTTSFNRESQTIEVTLEMPEEGDPSIFNKVLPAVIADRQSLEATKDIEKANLSANEQAGFSNLKLAVRPETKQTVKISWSFEKANLEDDLKNLYSKLDKYPEPILKVLYEFPSLVMGLLSA